MHSDPITQVEAITFFGCRTNYTKGGLVKFGFDHLDKEVKFPSDKYHVNTITDQFEEHMHSNRDGWYGWFGMGGSVMQWHPELNIGFSYVPTDLLILDICNYKASCL